MEDYTEEDRVAGELLALKAVVRWLVAQVLAKGPDPRGAARRLESDLLETIELARLAHSEEALQVATAAVQNMMDLLDFSPGTGGRGSALSRSPRPREIDPDA